MIYLPNLTYCIVGSTGFPAKDVRVLVLERLTFVRQRRGRQQQAVIRSPPPTPSLPRCSVVTRLAKTQSGHVRRNERHNEIVILSSLWPRSARPAMSGTRLHSPRPPEYDGAVLPGTTDDNYVIKTDDDDGRARIKTSVRRTRR